MITKRTFGRLAIAAAAATLIRAALKNKLSCFKELSDSEKATLRY